MKKIFYFSFLILHCYSAVAQKASVDSLKIVINSATDDSTRVLALNTLTNVIWRTGSFKSALKCAELAKKISLASEFKRGAAGAYNNIGVMSMSQGKFPEALENFFNSLKLNEELNNTENVAKTYNNIGALFWNKGDNEKAVEYYLKALDIYLQGDDKIGISNSYNNIGVVYAETLDYEAALDYYLKSLQLIEKLNNRNDLANTLNNISNVYWNSDKIEEALQYQKKALEIREEEGDKQGVAMSLVNLGGIYLDKKDFAKAIEYFKKCIDYCLKTGNPVLIKESEKLLYHTYEEMGDIVTAFMHYKRYMIYRDSIFNEEKTKEIVRTEMNYVFEKKQQETRLETEKKEALHKAELRSQEFQRNAFIGAFGLTLTIAGLSYRSFKNKKRANLKLEIQNTEIVQQKGIIEEKNKNILDSIKYAKRIQEAILPPENLLKKLLKDSFVFYKPKDIVSGDFYWLEQVDDKILLAAVDCTGHGVPGALMSIVGHNGLTRAVNEHNLKAPSHILDYLNLTVHETLRQTTEDSTVNDGMDISLISIQYTPEGKVKVEWSGANNPLWIIRRNPHPELVYSRDNISNGAYEPSVSRSQEMLKQVQHDKNIEPGTLNFELQEVKPDKQPIGNFSNPKPFTIHAIELQKNDCVYLFTDGFADQFGGDQGKKFKSANFKKLLLSIQHEPMEKQKQIIHETFETWKGNLEQVDDVCIIGVRV
jgi:serine phosphatase RsbU (regulator of sigma subunit)/Tfp pilus assembly protein PilF